MTAYLLALLSGFILAVISGGGYAGIALLMATESACIPLPSEIILPFSGYLAYTGRFELFWVATAAALGCNAGSIVAYFTGAWGGRPFLERYGKYCLISHKEIELADRWFLRYGHWTVFFGRLLPVIRTFIALPAGVARMSFGKFNVYTFLGSWPWCYALAYGGYKLGANWASLEQSFHSINTIAAGLLGLAAVVYIWLHLRGSRQAEDQKALSSKP